MFDEYWAYFVNDICNHSAFTAGCVINVVNAIEYGVLSNLVTLSQEDCVKL
jgi:hypothetical protein